MKKILITLLLFIPMLVCVNGAWGQVNINSNEQQLQKQEIYNDSTKYEYAKLLVVYVWKFATKNPEGMKPRTLRVLYPSGRSEMVDCSETEAINKMANEGYYVKSVNTTSHHDGLVFYINDYLLERRKR